MVSFEEAISVLKDNAGFEPNKYEDSFYRLYKTSKGYIQVRVSNHGTELWTWVKNAPVDPSECCANICIVLSDDGNHNSNTTADMNVYKKDDEGNNILGYDGKRIVIGKLNSFKVIQYVYNLSILSPRNIGIINAMIQRIPEKTNTMSPCKLIPKSMQRYLNLRQTNLRLQ